MSGSNFGKSFLGCFGSGWCAPGTAMTFVANQGIFVAMVARKLKFGLGDGGLIQVVLFSGGLEPPSSASGMS